MALDASDAQRLRECRTRLQHFLRWREDVARALGLTATRDHLLLAIRTHPDPVGPTIGELAAYLVLRHHSVVGLVDRAERDGLVRRSPDASSKSVVRVLLTPTAEEKLEALALAHRQELAHLAPMLESLSVTLEHDDGSTEARAARQREIS